MTGFGAISAKMAICYSWLVPAETLREESKRGSEFQLSSSRAGFSVPAHFQE